MNKKDFLDILQQSLEGEVDNKVLEQSVSFYNDYISSQRDKSEEEVIKEIGDPRLIAKTIIETEKLSSKNEYRSVNYDTSSSNSYNYNSNYSSKRRKIFPGINWLTKLAIIAIVFLFSIFIIKIGWFFLRIISIFIVPIILIGLLVMMFRNH